MYLEWTVRIYESGARHLLIFKECGPHLSGPGKTANFTTKKWSGLLQAFDLCGTWQCGHNYLMNFSKRNFCSHFPRECLNPGSLRTRQNTVSNHCCFAQHTASPVPRLPPSFLQAPSTVIQNTWIFPRHHFLPGVHLTAESYFPRAREAEPSIIRKKMIASAWGFHRDVLLQLFTNWLYSKPPWEAGAGRKEASKKTFVGMSEAPNPLRPPRGTSCLNTSHRHSQVHVHTQCV